MNLMQMMDSALEGRLKALWVIGYDIALTNPNMNETSKALQAVECIIVQDMFMTETARKFGTVFLPVASTFEKDGTFMNAERRIQLVRRMLDAPGNARPDWKIISDVAAAMGFGDAFPCDSPEAIWEEIRKVWPDGAGISYSRLQTRSLQWPCKNESDPGTDILHREHFAGASRAALHQVSFRPTPEQIDSDYPYRLITGRVLYQFNAGTMTLRTPDTILHPYDLIEISPQDASRLHLQDRARLGVISRYGEATFHVCITDRVRSGELFASFHTSDAHTNTLTGNVRDPVTQTPEYKITAVRLEVPGLCRALDTVQIR
jgi:formate dehydrogenase major subunit